MSYEMKEFTLKKDEYIDRAIKEIGGYRSPVEIIVGQIECKLEEDTLKAVHSCGIKVDKEEFLKALKYDREQYEKGYVDGLNANNWIPCSSGIMPEDGVVVQVTYIGFIDGKPYSDGHAYRENNQWRWSFDEDIPKVKITAWKHNCVPYGL